MMDPVFKVGDKVTLMRSVCTLREGEEFTVLDYYKGIAGYMCVALVDQDGRKVEYAHASRFQLTEEYNGSRSNTGTSPVSHAEGS